MLGLILETEFGGLSGSMPGRPLFVRSSTYLLGGRRVEWGLSGSASLLTLLKSQVKRTEDVIYCTTRT